MFGGLRRTHRVILASLIFLFTGCSSTHTVVEDGHFRSDELRKLNEQAETRQATILFGNGTLVRADALRLDSQSASWLDPSTRTSRTAPTETIREIYFIDRGRGALKGLAVGGLVVGLLLGGQFSRILISGSDVRVSHGSHPLLDKQWSSQQVTFVHHGEGVKRIDKARAIILDPLVQRYLHVCWEGMTVEQINCGECEKCVRTQCQLLAADSGLGDWQACFPTGQLGKKIVGLEHIPKHLHSQWVDIVKRVDLSEIRRLAVDMKRRRGPFKACKSRRSSRFRRVLNVVTGNR